MTASGGGVSRCGEAVARWDVERHIAQCHDGTVAEVDHGIGNSLCRQQHAKLFQGVAFQNAGEVENDVHRMQSEATIGRQHDGLQSGDARGDVQGGDGDGAIVYFGKFYNGIDKEDSFVEHQLSIEIIEDVK